MKTKLNIVIFLCNFFIIVCIIIFMLFFIYELNIYIIFSFICSFFLVILLNKKIKYYYSLIYKSYIAGERTDILNLSKKRREYILNHYNINDNKIVERTYFNYSLSKIQHPNFNQFKQNQTNFLPPNILNQFNYLNEKLIELDFQINKEINFSTGDKTLQTLLIDDLQKNFIIVKGFNITLRPFSDLLSSEIYNSSNNVQIGTQGYRTDMHTSLVINLKPNLQAPNITINFLNLHNSPFPNAAYDIKGALDYIIEYNNNNPS